MTRKYTLYVGLNDKDTKRQEVGTIEAYKLVGGLLAREMGGGTIYEAHGIYTHDDGTVVVEETLRIELFADEEERVEGFVRTVKRLLNQESVIIQTETVTSRVA